jgi:predicted small secreted protein
MKKPVLITSILVLSLMLTACSHTPGAGDNSAAGGSSNGSSAAASKFDSPFPVISDADQFIKLADDSINYQTASNVAQVAAFYRGEYTDLAERTIVTVEAEEVLNLVFDGSANGRALVIQVANLGEGNFNVNVRYEEV